MASSWTVELTGSARREFKLVVPQEKESAAAVILELAEDPFPGDAVPLRLPKTAEDRCHPVETAGHRIYRISKLKPS
jgi:hypothetical protein